MQANLVEIETDVVLTLVLPTGGSAPTSTKPFHTGGYPIRLSGLSRHSSVVPDALIAATLARWMRPEPQQVIGPMPLARTSDTARLSPSVSSSASVRASFARRRKCCGSLTLDFFTLMAAPAGELIAIDAKHEKSNG